MTNDILGEELTEELSMPEPLPAPCITDNILGEELTEEPSVTEPFPAPRMTNDILGEELTEEPSMPEPLPAPCITDNILGEALIEEPSMPEPLPATHITNNILGEVLIEETSMPGPLPTPCITNDLLGKVLIEATSVPGPSILTDTPKEAASVSKPLLEPSIADNYLQQDVELLKGLQHDYVQQQLRVRRISQQFPRSLRAINLQIGHMRTRLIRSEVRLQWWEREGQRDLHSCQEYLQSFKALRGQLRQLRSRLARVEATMGIMVPPRELDVAEEDGEGKLKETTVLLFI
ncbi:uncharacterized protein LOC128326003 [Hemicordylus capensis]|uniref:uncharacterized protein LOC128326003 n=1 Tax=Hemicordylus capensis TaxID=884348 RepID=UPI002302C344|nr:uncharacterized protein LOC128326003 [Hemicordylus capensis]